MLLRLGSAVILTVLIVLSVIAIGYIIDRINQAIVTCTMYMLGVGMGSVVLNYFTFVGVIHHELSHAIVALVTGAKIKAVKFFNLFHVKGGNLGSVSFIPRGPRVLKSIQLTLSSIAPIPLGMCTLYTLYNYLKNNELSAVAIGVLAYLMFSIIIHMRLSQQDIKTAKEGLPLVSLLLLVIIFIVM